MRILLLSTYDQAGGAEKVAYDLMRAYRLRGHEVRMLVRYRRTADPDVYEIDPYEGTSSLSGLCRAAERDLRQRQPFRGQYRLVDWLRRCAWPQRWIDKVRGVEDYNYPYSYHLTDEAEWHPDLIHAHNLHGDYFDLRALAILSRQLPVIWTLHDTWAFTGHCAYFLGCERWQTGCGHCPDLRRPPAVARDQTANNWRIKREIYSHSRLAIATPSAWLMGHVKQSILQTQLARIIPNGIDLAVFKQDDRREARSILGLPQDAFICTFAAQGGDSANPYKDYPTIKQAARMVAEQLHEKKVLSICIGSSRVSRADSAFHYTGYISDPRRMALYYQASDVLLHAANGENFPCVVLEASACGIPVIATAVGGIPEQIVDGKTGFLVACEDSRAMAEYAVKLAQAPSIKDAMGKNAALYTRQNFDIDRQVAVYLDWFEQLRYEYSKGLEWSL